MTIKEQVKEKLKEAMKNKDEVDKNTYKGILAEFTNFLVANGKTPQDEISDEEALKVIKKLKKQREDSIQKFLEAGRNDLAEKEKREKEILEEFLPEMLSEEEIKKIALELKEELGIEEKNKSGILVGKIIQKSQGLADGKMVKEVVDKIFD